MFKKIVLTIISIILITSIASCSESSTTTEPTSSPNNEVQEIQGNTYPEPSQSNSQQLLPVVSGDTPVYQLDASSDGITQEFKVGDLFAITLESNPSTGFSWFATSSNPKIVVQKGEAQYEEPQTSAAYPMLGAAGTEILTFETIGTGNATLTLDYKKGWESDVAPEKTITIIVDVK